MRIRGFEKRRIPRPLLQEGAVGEDDDEGPLEHHFQYKEFEFASPIFGNITDSALGSIRAELYYPITKEVRGRNLGNHIGHVALI